MTCMEPSSSASGDGMQEASLAQARQDTGPHSPSVPRPRGFWMSRISRPRLKIETVPVDWETQTAIESVVTVIAAAASCRVPRPWGRGSSSLPRGAR